MEIWKTCQGFSKYVVSPDGLIKNRDRDTLLSTRRNRQGVVMVNLMGDDNTKSTRSVALIVAQTYLASPKSESYNSIIYLDGDRSNCSATNLMWRPRWYAVRYHKMFDEVPYDISVIIEDTGEVFGTLRDACLKYGLDEKYAYLDILNGEKCFHYGFRLKRYIAS